MKICINYVILLTAVSVNYAQDEAAGGPHSWPPPCCSTRYRCDAKTLSKYCLPVPCPKFGCRGSETCSCLFPGTKHIISPRMKAPVPPRAPFCSDRPDHLCPVSKVKCPDFECPKIPIDCTYTQIQKMID